MPASLNLGVLRTLFQAVFRLVTGLVGSLGLGFPKGNTYHSGWIAENLSWYHSADSFNRGRKSGVQWNRASFTALGFALADCQVAPFQIDLIPSGYG
jgi:hypothetical protein